IAGSDVVRIPLPRRNDKNVVDGPFEWLAINDGCALPFGHREDGPVSGPVGIALEALWQQRETRAHGWQYRATVYRICIVDTRTVALVDIARRFQPVQDRSHLGIRIIDYRGAVEMYRRAVREHAGGITLERIAVLMIDVLHLLAEVRGERCLEMVDRRHVEYVEPHHRFLARVAVIVRRPVGRNDEITVFHLRLLALDCCISALAFEHEANGGSDMLVRVGNLAG